MSALLAAFAGVLLLLTGLLRSAALLLLTGLLLSAALLLPRLLIAALILLNIFVRISHLKYLIVKVNDLHVDTNSLIASYEKNSMHPQ